MSSRAQQLRERQAANVVANQKDRQRKLLKRGDPSALDQTSRTLSTKERAKMMQAKRSGEAGYSEFIESGKWEGYTPPPLPER